MNHLVKIIVGLFLSALIGSTIWFTSLQLQRSNTLDEALVSDLTTKLDTNVINQAVNRISSKTE